MLDFGSEEEARESGSAYEAKAKKRWSSKEAARWNTVYKGPKGWQLYLNKSMVIST
jgi:hypothetical protein